MVVNLHPLLLRKSGSAGIEPGTAVTGVVNSGIGLLRICYNRFSQVFESDRGFL
jgi:hypothetical protein